MYYNICSVCNIYYACIVYIIYNYVYIKCITYKFYLLLLPTHEVESCVCSYAEDMNYKLDTCNISENIGISESIRNRPMVRRINEVKDLANMRNKRITRNFPSLGSLRH